MRGIRKLGVAAVALAVGVLGASTSYALIDDPYTSYTQPANALVMPFDVEEDSAESYLIVSNVSGVSVIPGGGANLGVTTHWAFWSESCDHLADFYVCLTLNDTVIIDPRDTGAIDVGNQRIGPDINLGGNKGLVVITAYETDEICSDSSVLGDIPVDDAIVGAFTLADTASGASYGNDAIGLGLDFLGNFTELPEIETNAIDIQIFNPNDLDNSEIILLSLVEQSGNGSTADVEVGPNPSAITAAVTLYDTLEIATSLPDARIVCSEYTSALPGIENGLIPSTISVDSSGFLRLWNFSPSIGLDTDRFIYAIHGQTLGQFGASANGKYSVELFF
jgi:hypothetical protein